MKKYTKSGRMNPCKLEIDDLQDLIKILREKIPNSERKEDFEITTNLKNININSNSLEDFLAHRELPNNFNRLSLRNISWNENRIDKSIRIEFTVNFIELNIDGMDETWVLGKYTQVSNFLKNKKPWFWAINKIFPYLLGVILTISLIAISTFIKNQEIIYSISTVIFLISTIYAGILNLKGTFLPYTQIIINTKKSFFNLENITLLISLLSLLVSIIGGIIIPLFQKS
jgi:hypothetical protein